MPFRGGIGSPEPAEAGEGTPLEAGLPQAGDEALS